ncbi:MAG: outer membrane beta-barrel protein [Rikenellaceae bacterium]
MKRGTKGTTALTLITIALLTFATQLPAQTSYAELAERLLAEAMRQDSIEQAKVAAEAEAATNTIEVVEAPTEASTEVEPKQVAAPTVNADSIRANRPARPEGANGERPQRPEGANGEHPARPEGSNGERPQRPQSQQPTQTQAQTPQQSSAISATQAKAVDRNADTYDPTTFDTEFEQIRVRTTRATQKGDSLVYNASAFKVMEGSSAEDLLAKMPGIVVEGGEIQAQGESVRKVLVDGKEFFDGDVNLAIRSLPSDVISSIEVFDRQSDQAQFTGFDDGEQVKTINIVTKGGFKRGTFGEAYVGAGVSFDDSSDYKYKAGGNINLFDGDRRLSILGLSNNINQQNFSQEDLAGVMSSSSSGRGGRGSGGGPGGPGGSGSSSDNFMVGSTSGITKSNAIGLNYSNKFGEKLTVQGSYFFNNSNTSTLADEVREYFESSLPGVTYLQDKQTEMTNFNHRLSSRIEWVLNPNNTIMIAPKFSIQTNKSHSITDAANYYYGDLQDTYYSDSDSKTMAYNFSTDVTWRHRLKKAGRTLSISTTLGLSNTTGETNSLYQSITGINSTDTSTESDTDEDEYTNQLRDTYKKQFTGRLNVMYTESLHKNLQLSAAYKLSYSNTKSLREVYDKDPNYDLYEQLAADPVLDESLSNNYTSDYLTQSGGLALRFNKGKLNATVGGDVQYAMLDGVQTYPTEAKIDHNYLSFLPSAMVRYSVDRSNSFQLRYRSSSSAPSITELQDVIDNTNELYLTSGNPELNQQINHTASLRYIRTTNKGTSIIVMAGATVRQDYVADSTYVATTATTLPNGMTLAEGAQITTPVNMDGYYSLQGMLTYGFPIDFLRSNVNMSMTANYTNTPTIFDEVSSFTRDISLTPKVIIGSNISEKLDFTVTYSAGMNYALSSDSDSSDGNYMLHSASAKIGWTFWKGMTLRSTLSYIAYTGLDLEDPDYMLWNVSLGKKLCKKDRGELKIEAYDILNQNQAISRTVGSNYYSTTTSNVLSPYVMVTFQYMFR